MELFLYLKIIGVTVVVRMPTEAIVFSGATHKSDRISKKKLES